MQESRGKYDCMHKFHFLLYISSYYSVYGSIDYPQPKEPIYTYEKTAKSGIYNAKFQSKEYASLSEVVVRDNFDLALNMFTIDLIFPACPYLK